MAVASKKAVGDCLGETLGFIVMPLSGSQSAAMNVKRARDTPKELSNSAVVYIAPLSVLAYITPKMHASMKTRTSGLAQSIRPCKVDRV
eukprot:3808611-Amphidinium_carterae.1